MIELKTQTGQLSPRQNLVFNELSKAGFPVYVLHSKEEVEDFINHVAQRSTPPVSDRDDWEGEIHPQLGSISTPGFGEDDDIYDDTSGAV